MAALCACGGSEERDATDDDIKAFNTAVAYASDYHDGYTLKISTSYFYISYSSDGEITSQDEHTIDETVSSKGADSDFLMEYGYIGSSEGTSSHTYDYVDYVYLMQDESTDEDEDSSGSTVTGYYREVNNIYGSEKKEPLNSNRLPRAIVAYDKYSDFASRYGSATSILTLSSIKTYIASYSYSLQSSTLAGGDLTYRTEGGAGVYSLKCSSDPASSSSSYEETISFYIKGGKITEVKTVYTGTSYSSSSGKASHSTAYEQDIKVTYSYSKSLMPTDFSSYK